MIKAQLVRALHTRGAQPRSRSRRRRADDRARRVSAARRRAVPRSARCDRPRSQDARRRRGGGAGDAPPRADPDDYARVMALNEYLFGELRFVGNSVTYEDPRNSFLNEVLDRRTGIPITLALLYMEVARRAGVHVEGVNFPGHFLLRCPARRGLPQTDDLIIDAVPRRRAAVGGRLPRAAPAPCRRGGRRRIAPAGARHEAADPRAHAAEPQAPVRADALVSAGARRHRAAAGGRPVGHQRAAGSRAARLSPEGLLRARCAICRPTCSSPDPHRSTRTTARSTPRSGSTSRRCGDGSLRSIKRRVRLLIDDC